jgi:hypothetical protein
MEKGEVQNRHHVVAAGIRWALEKGTKVKKINVLFNPSFNRYHEARYERARDGLEEYEFKQREDGFLVLAPNEKVYFTRWFPNGGSSIEECSCSCPDFLNKSEKFHQPCKHVWMVKLKKENGVHVQTSG